MQACIHTYMCVYVRAYAHTYLYIHEVSNPKTPNPLNPYVPLKPVRPKPA